MNVEDLKLGVLHEECFVDEATISQLYDIKGMKRKYLLLYEDEWDRRNSTEYDISEEEAVKWVLEKYTNEESSSEEIKEEKMYMLHLMGISVTKIGEYFGVSRQTVHKKIKSFENNRLQKFRPYRAI